MAADNKQQVASDQPTSGVKVGSGGQVKYARRFPKLKIGRKSLFYVLVIIVVLVGGWIVFRKETHVGEKVYAEAAGHKVYAAEIKQIKGTAKGIKGISDQQAATVLADKYLTEAMGKQDKISVTEQEVVTTYGKSVVTQKKSQPYYYQRDMNSLYFKKLAIFNQSGVYAGAYLIANFGENIPYSLRLLAEQKAGNPNLGNKQAIASDEKYAGDLLTKLYNQITTHKITFDQAVKEEQEDPRVGIKAYPTQPHSGSFSTTGDYGLVVNADATRAKLHTIKQGTMTKPFVAGGSDIQTGPYYLVIRMDQSRGGPGLPYSQFLQQAKQKYGYKVYV